MGKIKFLLRKIEETIAYRCVKKKSFGFAAQGHRKIVFAHDHTTSNIEIFGIYDKAFLDELSKLLKDEGYLNSTCLDVGANIGNHTIVFASLFNKVIAFEPNHEVLPLLKYNTSHFNNVEIMEYGAGEYATQLRATASRHNIGGASIKRALNEDGNSDKAEYVFNIKSIDEMIGASIKDISFIKLDVEGQELSALKGAAKIIDTCSPIISMEVHKEEFETEKGASSINYLKSKGYKYFYSQKPYSSIKTGGGLNIFNRLLKYRLFQPNEGVFLGTIYTVFSIMLYFIGITKFPDNKIIPCELGKEMYHNLLCSKTKLESLHK